MAHLGFKLIFLCGVCFHGSQLQSLEFADDNDVYLSSLADDWDLDWSGAKWHLVIPWLLQRQQLRLCMAVARFDGHLIPGTGCEKLLANRPLMATCDIGHIEDITMTMRGAFGATLLDTSRKCRPGLELFGVRCRRRA
ncbi:hypothetical protein KR018_012403 [Drosophila ironensis]|nr:hypothetical protein KR018_012403 [Drosophila ironensis]